MEFRRKNAVFIEILGIFFFVEVTVLLRLRIFLRGFEEFYRLFARFVLLL